MSQKAMSDVQVNRRDVLSATTAGAALALLGGAVKVAAAEASRTAPGPATTPDLAPASTSASAAASAAASAQRESLGLATAAVDAARDAIVKISRDVWRMPAVGLQEHEAMEVHIAALERAGFRTIQRVAGGHPTAFVSEWSNGMGGPKLGFLPEYDALPGLGNVAEPVQKLPGNGDTDGHGCGHNCLGAACTGAAIALKSIMENRNLSGTIRVYGCGAEENVGAKVFMAEAGLFDDLDAAIAWHPAPVAATGTISTAANRKIAVNFIGKTAHAGVSPWEGRSALDAAELFAHGLNMMREHLQPTARMHYIYRAAGVAPNIVPDDARIWMTARDKSSELVNQTTQWLSELAQGAAMGTQTKADFRVVLGLTELIPNEVIARRVLEHMQGVPLEWTAEEQAFAKSCQKQMGVMEAGMATQVMPFMSEITTGGSSDMGDVSFVVPVCLFGWPTFPLGISAHTWAVTACGGTTIGDKGTLGAAKLMVAVGYDLLTEPELRKAAKQEHTRRLAGRVYRATLDREAAVAGESPKRFSKGLGDETLSGIGS